MKLQIIEFLHSALYWDKWPASLPGCLNPEGNGSSYLLIGRWVEPRVSPDDCEKEVNLSPLPPLQARFLNYLFRNLLGIPTELLRLRVLLLLYHLIFVKVLKYTFLV